MKGFMRYSHSQKKVESWKKPFKVKTIKVSKISGLLPREDFPSNFLIDSNFLNVPTKYDQSLQVVEVDTLCN
jgi:hypothetical protein